ncbi:MAG: hypothetical protein GF311_23315 [Candidatus Lokiarchaeota archaeon]|nr:hypothetical protein [Candidatus Lokiarchaeota archaeon]
MGIVIILGIIGAVIIFLEGSQDFIMVLYYELYTVGFYFVIFLAVAIMDNKITGKLAKYYKEKEELLKGEHSDLISKLTFISNEITNFDDIVDRLRIINDEVIYREYYKEKGGILGL